MKAGLSNFVSFQPPVEQGSTVTATPECQPAAGFAPPQGPSVRLTPRESEVLALLCEGLPNKLISRRLQISSATVKCHISRILSELGVSSRLQAVVAAARRGLVGEPGVTGSHASPANVRHASHGGLLGSVRPGTSNASL
jgi:DNA-binding NarL/FixJ family response regulator